MDEEDTSVRDGRPTIFGLVSIAGHLLLFNIYTQRDKLSYRRLRRSHNHRYFLRCLRVVEVLLRRYACSGSGIDECLLVL
jgi:hypothetical protein